MKLPLLDLVFEDNIKKGKVLSDCSTSDGRCWFHYDGFGYVHLDDTSTYIMVNGMGDYFKLTVCKACVKKSYSNTSQGSPQLYYKFEPLK